MNINVFSFQCKPIISFSKSNNKMEAETFILLILSATEWQLFY